jgi:hypothetical protein
LGEGTGKRRWWGRVVKDTTFIRRKQTSDCPGGSQTVPAHSFGKGKIMLKVAYNIQK